MHFASRVLVRRYNELNYSAWGRLWTVFLAERFLRFSSLLRPRLSFPAKAAERRLRLPLLNRTLPRPFNAPNPLQRNPPPSPSIRMPRVYRNKRVMKSSAILKPSWCMREPLSPWARKACN